MDPHNIPPQEHFLYKGLWTAEMDMVFLSTLVNEKPYWIPDPIPICALLSAQEDIHTTFGIQPEWDSMCERFTFMKTRFETFKYCRRHHGVHWDVNTNKMFGPDQTWTQLFENCELAKAYYTRGEPEFDKLSILFGADTVKEETPSRIVVNLSSTVSLSSPDCEEVTSPIMAQNPPSRRRLFDEESSTNPRASSGFPGPNAFPRRPKFDNMSGSKETQSSEASSSSAKTWRKS